MKTIHSLSLALAASALVSLAGCHKDNDDKPAASLPSLGTGQATADVGGTWNGTINGSAATLTLTQTGNAISGQFNSPSNSGSFSGTLNGNTLTFQAEPGLIPSCGVALQGTGTLSGNTLTLNLTNQTTGTATGTGTGVIVSTISAPNIVIGSTITTPTVIVSSGTACPSASTSTQSVFTRTTSNTIVRPGGI